MLSGRSALVTGSVDGIGLAIGEGLASQGCAVMLNGLAEAEAMEPRLESLRRSGMEVQYCRADLSVPDEIAMLVTATEAAFSKVDIVVNNAVTRCYAVVEELPVEQWNYALAVNLSAPFHVLRLVMPGMKRRGWGRVINIASNYGCAAPRGGSIIAAQSTGLSG